MRVTMHPAALRCTEEVQDATSPFRERIAERSEEHAALFPRAVLLEARVIAALHNFLHGVASSLRGIHSVRRFWEILRGERHFNLADLCRLATDPTREARDAALAAVGELAMALGYRLVPLDPLTVDLHEGVAGLAEATGELLGGISRDLKDDGRQDAEEARRRLPQVEVAQRHLSRLASTVARTAAS